MKPFTGLEKITRTDVPLGQYTWFGIGGPADYLIEPETLEQLSDVAVRCRENDIPVHVLGGGANLLIDDAGVRGAVIRLCRGEFAEVTLTPEGVRAGAGVDMGKLVLRCVREGLSGLEGLTGIPGTVGGCVRMNAGGKFGDIGSAVETVDVMTREGDPFQRTRDDLAFAYRSTNISSRFITGATFRLTPDDPHRIVKQVKQIWIYKKNTQPLGAGSAGCVFKNPRGMSAGALIDKAGFKGKRSGGAVVSEKHANFVIAEDGATSADMLNLINDIRETIYKQDEVYLELELEVW
ncbi:MAG: UDP-N-acetylmuramate dehydrogenase [Phycisphaerae bacterium]